MPSYSYRTMPEGPDDVDGTDALRLATKTFDDVTREARTSALELGRVESSEDLPDFSREAWKCTRCGVRRPHGRFADEDRSFSPMDCYGHCDGETRHVVTGMEWEPVRFEYDCPECEYSTLLWEEPRDLQDVECPECSPPEEDFDDWDDGTDTGPFSAIERGKRRAKERTKERIRRRAITRMSLVAVVLKSEAES